MMAMDDSEIVNGGEMCDKFRAVQVTLDLMLITSCANVILSPQQCGEQETRNRELMSKMSVTTSG
jgi:hypothetical protein